MRTFCSDAIENSLPTSDNDGKEDDEIHTRITAATGISP